jgi:hypothetical protein
MIMLNSQPGNVHGVWRLLGLNELKVARSVSDTFVLLLVFSVVALVTPMVASQPDTAPGVALNLSGSIGDSLIPQVAMAGSNVYVIWWEATSDPTAFDVFLRRSIDGGSSFGSKVNLSGTGTASAGRVAVSGSNVYVVWTDSPGNGDVFLRRSVNGGASFEPVVNLSQNSGFSSAPHVAVSGSNVYVVWGDRSPGNWEVFVRSSINEGATFRPTENLSHSTGNSFVEDIEASGSRVYVLWTDDTSGNDDVFLTRSLDRFLSYRSTNLSENTGDSNIANIEVSSSNVYVAWQDDTLGDGDVLFRRSVDGGDSFGSAVNLGGNLGLFGLAHVESSGSNVYVAWYDTSGNHDVFLRRSVDGGASFDPVVNLSNNPGDSTGVDVEVSGSEVYVSWQDETPGISDIFLRRSVDGGASFDPVVNLSNNPGDSFRADVALLGSDVHAVWHDNTAGNMEVLYFRDRPPDMPPISGGQVDEGTERIISAFATDPDEDELFFSLGPGTPPGATISQDGLFSWTPSEIDGPGSFPITIIVTDGLLSDTQTTTITVREVNLPPVLDVPFAQTVGELAPLTFGVVCSDPDIPANSLTISASGLPLGASFSSTPGGSTRQGTFSWTPGEAQGPGDYTVNFTCADNGTPSLSDTKSIAIYVNEVNVAPSLTFPGAQTVNELAPLTFTLSCSDSDIPANSLALSTSGLPSGASFNQGSGTFTWTPSEDQGPRDYTVSFTCSDGSLSDEPGSVAIHVNEANVDPVLDPVGEQTIAAGSLLAFTATAQDSDVPDQTLTFSLGPAASGTYPTGATITPGGAFSWTPSEAQGPGTYSARITVSDAAGGADFQDITITVNEAIGPPPDRAAPLWITGLLSASNIGQNSITLAWPRATDNLGVVRYNIYSGENLVATISGDTQSYTVTGLSPGTTYTFKVSACDAAGNCGELLTQNFTTSQLAWWEQYWYLIAVAVVAVVAAPVLLKVMRRGRKLQTTTATRTG